MPSILPAISPYVVEAERIADNILSKAIITSKGLTWPCITAAYSKDRIVRQPNISLANGNSGIAVFLCETYKRTESVNFLEAASSAIDWVEAECSRGSVGAKSLWFGQFGAVEALLSLFDVTKDESVLERAKVLSIKCGECYFTNDKEAGPTLSGIGAGAAGALLTLLRVFEKTQDERVLELSCKLLKLIVSRARMAPCGIYWDRMGDTIRPPIGFLSGTSGIAYALAEANKIIPFEACGWIVNQAVRYENSFLADGEMNWPDLSYSTWTLDDIKILPKKIRKALKNDDDDFFSEFGDSASWANGCTGIALARVACSLFLTNDVCAEDIATAQNRIDSEFDLVVSSMEEMDLSLSGGLTGVSLGCLELHRRTGNEIYRKLAEAFGSAIIKQRKNFGYYRSGLEAISDGEDIGFFTGSSGIGYYMLKLSDEEIEPSLLAPSLNITPDLAAKTCTGNMPTRSEGVACALSSLYPRTVTILKKMDHNLLQGALTEISELSSRSEIQGVLSRTIPLVDQGSDQALPLDELYQIEKARCDLDFCSKGDRYLSLKVAYNRSNNMQTLNAISEKKFLSMKLVMVPETRVLECNYRLNFENNNGDFEVENTPTYYFHHQQAERVYEAVLPDFNYLVLSCFRKTMKVKVALKRIMKLARPKNEAEEEKVRTVAVDQLKEGLRSGLLCRCRFFK